MKKKEKNKQKKESNTPNKQNDQKKKKRKHYDPRTLGGWLHNFPVGNWAPHICQEEMRKRELQQKHDEESTKNKNLR